MFREGGGHPDADLEENACLVPGLRFREQLLGCVCGWEAGKGRPCGLRVLGSEPGGVGLPGSELPPEQQPLSVLSQWRLQVVSKMQTKEVGREPHASSLLPDRPRGSRRW